MRILTNPLDDRRPAMRAMIMRAIGGVDVLEHASLPAPEPADGQVLVRVHAAAVNPVDWKQRRGLVAAPMPTVPGSDVSGTVEVSRAADFAVGDAVCGLASSGGYAEFATAEARNVVHTPHRVPSARAAAVPVSGLTAWQALFDSAALRHGQTVLIAGAAGGVGHLAVQFAALAGAQVIGTGSTRNRDFVLGLGAHRYVDYTRQEVADAVSSVDVVIDTVGGPVTRSLVPVVRPGGVLVSTEYPTPADWPATEDRARAARVSAVLMVMRPDRSQLRHITDLVADGAVQIELAGILHLVEAGRAQLLSEAGHIPAASLSLTCPRRLIASTATVDAAARLMSWWWDYLVVLAWLEVVFRARGRADAAGRGRPRRSLVATGGGRPDQRSAHRGPVPGLSRPFPRSGHHTPRWASGSQPGPGLGLDGDHRARWWCVGERVTTT